MGSPPTERLAVSHEVGADAEIFLRAAPGNAETQEHLVEDQHDAPRAANLPQLFQPRAVRRAVEVRLASAVHQRGIGGRGLVGVQGLQGVDEHAGDVAPRTQHMQGRLGQLGKGVGFAGRQRVAHAGLHVPPPAVVRPAEAHQVRAPGVITRQPHGLHHRLRAGHVERYFVHPGNCTQPGNIVRHHGMIRAEDRPQRAGALVPLLHALLVEVVTKDVHAVGTREIVETIAVEVRERHPLGRRQERTRAQVLAHDPAVLERHAVNIGELQIGDARRSFGGEMARLGEPLAVQCRQPLKAVASAGGDSGGCVVRAKETILPKFVERHQPGHPTRQARMPGQRAMLCAGEFQGAF